MPTALVTRPEEDSKAVAAELAARGLDVVTEPLLDIRPLAPPVVETAGIQGILATSANGVRALARILADRDLPVWAVGDATARVAHEFGYGNVEAAGGDVDSLAELVSARCTPDAGAFLHAAGTVVAGDLAGMLGAQGFQVKRLVLYEAVTAPKLSPALAERLRDGRLDLALFFSPRTAATFATLVRTAGLSESLAHVDAYALSANVARELSGLTWRKIRTATCPAQAALLAALDEDLEHPGSP